MPDASPLTPAASLEAALADLRLSALTVRQLNLLVHASRDLGTGTTAASEALGIPKSMVVWNVRHLAQLGLLNSTRNFHNLRLNVLALTPAGQEAITPLLALVRP